MPSTINTQKQSPFFRLPTEIRNIIYDEAILSGLDQIDNEIRSFSDFVKQKWTRPLPPLMRACKLLYREVAPFALTTAAIEPCKLPIQILPIDHPYYTLGWTVEAPAVKATFYGTLDMSRIRTIFLVYGRKQGFSSDVFLDVAQLAPQVQRLYVNAWKRAPFVWVCHLATVIHLSEWSSSVKEVVLVGPGGPAVEELDRKIELIRGSTDALIRCTRWQGPAPRDE